jgi:hypothetical protein
MVTMVTKVIWGFRMRGFPTKSLLGKKMHVGFHVKRPSLLSDFNQNWMCRQILVKLSNIKFHGKDSRVVTYGETDRHGEANMSIFANLSSNEPKICN